MVTYVPGAVCNIYQKNPDQPAGPSDEVVEAFGAYLEINRQKRHSNPRHSLEDSYLAEDDASYTEYHELFLDVDAWFWKYFPVGHFDSFYFMFPFLLAVFGIVITL